MSILDSAHPRTADQVILLPFLLIRIEVRWSGFEYSIFN